MVGGLVPKPLPRATQQDNALVSVVVCASNEAENLARNLPHILTQDYFRDGRPAYEVIVVDDASTDNSAAVLRSLSAQHPHLRVITIRADEPRTAPGKKFALSRGVAAASHPILLLTDADCEPASKHWITGMAASLAAGVCDIHAGYGRYTPAPDTLNVFIRCETVHTALQYTVHTQQGRPYMAVGRNLAVRKVVLETAQLDPLWASMPSGDDDLLVRLCATPQNMQVTNAPETFTTSPAKATFAEYIRQKQRHLSTGKLYRPAIKRMLGAAGMTHVGFWVLAVVLALAWMIVGPPPMARVVVAASVVRVATFLCATIGWAVRLREGRLWMAMPLYDAALAGYYLFFAPYILWKSKQQWT